MIHLSPKILSSLDISHLLLLLDYWFLNSILRKNDFLKVNILQPTIHTENYTINIDVDVNPLLENLINQLENQVNQKEKQENHLVNQVNQLEKQANELARLESTAALFRPLKYQQQEIQQLQQEYQTNIEEVMN
ncbi:hypothetical protein DLAC_06501 [Tieghemostelium lacteum]|uniref:Uncharacterized protein n=1 Tax=Tieghemostelium lacteum TaxID=361077 RepID=A0A151ZEW4_TIELA|nr:hypothetical protein DLAC_06501 [Tieghemostelium lacteum]|eukprot:KYQ92512.1 hypothetical protein DLAC_06501 [Tieghemostelium lacteum]